MFGTVVAQGTVPGQGRAPLHGFAPHFICADAFHMLDVPAEVIALIYWRRWAIGTFSRFFKHVLGCRHLISQSENGIEIQVYVGMIACLLIALWTGRKPTLRTYEMICFYSTGSASEHGLPAHVGRLKPQP